MQFTPSIIYLRKNGYRIGKVRKALIHLFSRAHKPLSAQDISTLLAAQNISANTTSVYRELDFLKSRNMIVELYIEANTRHFESADQKHHHHLVCENCDQITAIEDDRLEQRITDLQLQLERTHAFTTGRHALEFFGLCRRCQ